MITLVQNDVGVALKFVVRDTEGNPVDITGAIAKLTIINSAGSKTVDCTITDAVNGACQYKTIAGDLATIGLHRCELEVFFPDGSHITTPEYLEFTVRAELA